MGEILQGELLERVLELKRIKNLRRLRKFAEAKEEILKYVEKYPDDYYGLFTAGRIFANCNCFDQAEEYLLKVANSDSPNRFSAYNTLGEIAEKKGNKDKAVYYYKQAIFENPNIEKLSVVSLTNILIADKKYEEAYKLISLIEKTSPDYYNAAIADIYANKKLFADAKKYIDKVKMTGFSSFDRKIYLRKVIINKHLQNYAEAFLYLAKLTSRNDIYYRRSLIEKADIYFELKDYDKAYETCLKCDQSNPKVNYLLGRLNENNGDIAEAKNNYLLATKAKSQSIIRDNSHHLGDIFCEEGDFDKALDLYKLSASKSEVFPLTVYFKIISILIKNKSYDEAYEYLIKMKEFYHDIEKDALYKVVNTYLRKILGKEINTDDLSFKESMIVNYSHPKVIKHIKDFDSDTRVKFSHQTSIEAIYEYAQNNLSRENKLETRVLDTYDIYMHDVGYKNGEFTSKLRVVTIPHTNLILDMYPSFEETLKDKINYQKYKCQLKK